MELHGGACASSGTGCCNWPLACTPAGANDGPVNIGNPDDERSIAELARCCAAAAGLPPERVQTAPPGNAQGLMRCAPDIGRVRARARTPLPALTPLTEGLELLRDWIRWGLADD